MSTAYKTILLVTNEVANARAAEKTALKLAKANDARVIIVDSVRTSFYAPRYMSAGADLIFDVAFKSKGAYLEKVANRFREAGVDVETHVLLSSRTSVDIIATALGEGCDLIVRYLKGESSRAAGRFGQTAQNLISACPIPVLLVDQDSDYDRVAAFMDVNHSPQENRAIMNAARNLASSDDHINIVCCWEPVWKDFQIDYVDEGLLEQTNEEADIYHRKRFVELPETIGAIDLAGQTQLFKGSPIDIIPTFCEKEQTDVAVMCSASMTQSFGALMGNTITRVIDRLPCALLVVKPIGFNGSIQPKPIAETKLQTN